LSAASAILASSPDLFSYYIHSANGLEKFARAASEAGADGVLVTDLTPRNPPTIDVSSPRIISILFSRRTTSTDDR